MSGEEAVDAKGCRGTETPEGVPRFWLYLTDCGVHLVCQRCDQNIFQTREDVNFADVVKAVASHSGSAIDEEGTERARQEARKMFGGLMPGITGINLANEAADRLVAAYLGVEVPR